MKILLILFLLTVGGNIFYLFLTFLIKLNKFKVGNATSFPRKTVVLATVKNNFLNYSAFIGYFERILMYLAFLSNIGIQSLTILIAIKSFVRYPEIKASNDHPLSDTGNNNNISAEKFLFGTLCSIIWTLLISFIIHFY